MYFNDNNKESFRISIIDVLNSSDYNERINEELFTSFIKEIIEPEIEDLSTDEIITNPIIIKLANDKTLYNKYINKIIKIKHEDYIEKVNALINKKSQLIYDYALTNIDIVNFNSELETKIMDTFLCHILDGKLFHLAWQRFFIKYVIYSSTNLRPSVYGYSFSYYLKKKKNHLNFKLYKNNTFNCYQDYPIINYHNSSIYINLGLFKVISDSKGFNFGLHYLLNSCFKYLTKYINKNKETSNFYDLEMYRFMKEEIIYKEDNIYYNKNQNYFESNINLSTTSQELINSLLSKPMFSKLNIPKFINLDYSQFKNSSNYYSVDEYLDNLIYSAPSIILDYPMLKMEYNSNGKRKNVQELVSLKTEKLEKLNLQIKEFDKLIENDTNNKLLSKRDTLNLKLKGVIKCHNNMIYKSIRKYELNDFKNLILELNDYELASLLESIKQEKETFINKLSNNRKNIFKNNSFLENDEFLSNEYSIAATFESVIKTIKNL